MSDEIIKGADILGALIMGHKYNSLRVQDAPKKAAPNKNTGKKDFRHTPKAPIGRDTRPKTPRSSERTGRRSSRV